MTANVRTLLGLVAGLALGALLPASLEGPVLAVAEPVGTLWVNAIRMTVVPLVVALLLGAVATVGDSRALGRIGARAAAWTLGLLVLAVTLVALVAPPVLAALPMPPVEDALRLVGGAGAAPPVAGAVGLRQWLVELVPPNPVKAAADGALLPLAVFTIALGLALGRLAPERRAALLVPAAVLADALLVVVRWVLLLAPLGVLALALPLGARLGGRVAAALASYVLLTAVLCALLLVVLYVAAAVIARESPLRFARAAAPAQLVAAGTRSSYAALPAMIRGAAQHLRAPRPVVDLLLPLTIAVFRLGASVGIVLGTVFLARLYGVPLAPLQLATVAATAVLLSFGIPGVPSGVFLVMTPLLASLGIPAAGIGILIAVDPLADPIRTLVNVTADVALVALVGEREDA